MKFAVVGVAARGRFGGWCRAVCHPPHRVTSKSQHKLIPQIE
jgi:hypothetical protein